MQNSFQMDQMNRPLDFKSVDDAYIQALQEEFSMDEESCDEDSDPNIINNMKLDSFGLDKTLSNFNNLSQVNNKKTPPPKGKKTKGRVKIKMEFIDNKLRRYTTFSKRKTGIMKKAYELSTLTGTQVMLLVASETGHVYTFATRKLQPMITSETGKALIQTCLNSPDLPSTPPPASDQRMSATGFEETDFTYSVIQEEQAETSPSPQFLAVSSPSNSPPTAVPTSSSSSSQGSNAPYATLIAQDGSTLQLGSLQAIAAATGQAQLVPPPPLYRISTGATATTTTTATSSSPHLIPVLPSIVYQTAQGMVYAPRSDNVVLKLEDQGNTSLITIPYPITTTPQDHTTAPQAKATKSSAKSSKMTAAGNKK